MDQTWLEVMEEHQWVSLQFIMILLSYIMGESNGRPEG